ncbi:MAG TPA: tetratricopeptide repeat protein [Verrucomicrobiales bacterium]|nr:tetratricopeptide repeat protein [Verrucomicrobiales bacterium]
MARPSHHLRLRAAAAFAAAAFSLCLAPHAPAEMPLSREFWRDPSFTRSFMGLFTPENRIEPFVSAEEKAILSEVARLMAGGDREPAIRRLRNESLSSSSAALQFNLGILLFQEDGLDEAADALTKALELYPDFRRAHASLGAVHMRRDDLEAALPFLQRAVELGDHDGLTLGLLGYCRLQQNHYASALQAYRLAQLSMPDNPDWQAGEAECLRQTGDHAAAVRLFSEVLANRPGEHETWVRLASALMSLERHDQAAAALEVVRRLDRLTAPDTLLLGQLYLQLQSPSLALARFREAIAAQPPPEPAAAIEAADLLSQALAWPEAAELLEKIREHFPTLESDPQTSSALDRLDALVAMETGEPAVAVPQLEAIVSRDPMDGRVLVALGRYFAAQDNVVEAEIRLQQAARVSEYETAALRELGQLHVSQGDYTTALRHLRRAHDLQPGESLSRYIHAIERAEAAAAGF